ncbi:hypothetical protein Pcinc_028825 [Petrolisthes cinctipes]|uniref:Glucose-methanol-choline oxidoreductase N-terminal domain-containing protein n=1 Tax=Petrolisthes cinctipes TaxID=88211 RepID=A0AAE1K8R6_PETCI|nr:hypothetical protein Pcinc_028825 [Petrolisthes cinctipes]
MFPLDLNVLGEAVLRGVTSTLLPIIQILLPILLPQSALPTYPQLIHLRPQYDFIVVGAGSAGSVVGARLAEERGWSVLVVEEGGPPPPRNQGTSTLPSTTPPQHPTDCRYSTTPQRHGLKGYVNRVGRLVCGRGIGGSSQVNGMMYVRGARQDYDRWAALGNPGWSYNDVLPFFHKAEHYIGPDTGAVYGRGGPIGLKGGLDGPLTNAFLKGGVQLGFPFSDVNSHMQLGFSPSTFTIRNGKRSSTADSYLHPTPPNLHLLHSTKVLRIIFNEEKRAVGVELEHKGKLVKVGVRREVIVSAGALSSPQVLMLSGVGPRDHLASHKIAVVADVGGVGANLQDHVGVNGLVWTLPPDSGFLTQYFNAFKQYRRDSSGRLGTPDTELVNAWIRVERESGDPSWPDTQIFLSGISPVVDKGATYPSIWGLDRHRFKQYFIDILGQRGMSIRPTLVQPLSRGLVNLRSNNPHQRPAVNPNYLVHPKDVNRLIAAIKFSLTLGNTTNFNSIGAKFYTKALPGCSHIEYGSDKYWSCYVRHMATTTYHYSGTCKMAPPSDPLGVVDHQLRVRGVMGLRVVDASVMPVVPTGNTNAPVIMIAERAAHLIKQDWTQH